MKLIKLMYKFDTPLKETVTSFFSRDNEETLKEKYILVSDSKYRLLEFAHVGMHTYSSFTETEVHDMTNFLKDDYYVIKEIIEPSKFDEKTFTLDKYNLGEFIFFYKEPPIPPEKVKKPKFHEGTFNYELSEKEKKEIIKIYEKELKEYETKLKNYNTELADFKKKELLPIYGCVGKITTIKEKVPFTPLIINSEKKLNILFDSSFETTKDVEQFTYNGKLPKGFPTLVSKDVGGFKAGDSISGLSLTTILTKLFKLEKEEELVGTINEIKKPSTPSENTVEEENSPETQEIEVEKSVVSNPITISITANPTKVSNSTTKIVISAIITPIEEISKVEFYQDSELMDTITEDFSNIEYEIEGISKDTIFKFIATNKSGETKQSVKTIKFTN